MTVVYHTAQISGPGLGVMPPPHGFPVDPVSWWVPRTVLGDTGDPITGLQDLAGTTHLTQFGAGGKTIGAAGTARWAILDSTQLQRLQSAIAFTGFPATVVGLTRVAAVANANIINIGPYVIQRAATSTRLTLMDVGKTGTNWIRIPDAGTDWILWAAVLDGDESLLRIHGGATAGPGTVDGTGTPGVTVLAGNTSATPVEIAELAILPGARTTGQITASFEAVAARWPTLTT